jgi:hypothetical protein
VSVSKPTINPPVTSRLLANTHTLHLNFVPRRPEAEVMSGYKHVLATLYSPARYFQRVGELYCEF